MRNMVVARSVKQLDSVRQQLQVAQGTVDRLKQQDPVCNTKECVVSGIYNLR